MLHHLSYSTIAALTGFEPATFPSFPANHTVVNYSTIGAPQGSGNKLVPDSWI